MLLFSMGQHLAFARTLTCLTPRKSRMFVGRQNSHSRRKAMQGPATEVWRGENPLYWGSPKARPLPSRPFFWGERGGIICFPPVITWRGGGKKMSDDRGSFLG